MQNANRSASERTRFLGARTLAVYHQSNPSGREAGVPNTFASSMVSYRVPGQMGYAQATNSAPQEVAACCGQPCTAPGEFQNLQSLGIFEMSWDPVPNATYYTISADPVYYDPPYNLVINYPDNTATSATVQWDDYNNIVFKVSAFNACGSSQGTVEVAPCFLAGSLVQMADGSVKPIEEVVVGEYVLGAFGEFNQVLALHRPLLGSNTMCKINNEHSTTSHHPHISVDKGFYCVHPDVVETATYGKEHPVLNAAGEVEMRFLHGLQPGRVQPLVVGTELKTVEGSRCVSDLVVYRLPAETQLYNLVVGGSHTYHVDGYAVTGWPREDDFDYDTWTAKSS